jgi:hypothetical protein
VAVTLVQMFEKLQRHFWHLRPPAKRLQQLFAKYVINEDITNKHAKHGKI